MKFAVFISSLLVLFLGLSYQRCEASSQQQVGLVEIFDIDSLVPSIVTPTILPNLTHFLQTFHIDQARVAGWNDHRGLYVLHANGALVPGIPERLPNKELFYRKLPDSKFKVVLCIINPSNPCERKYYEAGTVDDDHEPVICPPCQEELSPTFQNTCQENCYTPTENIVCTKTVYCTAYSGQAPNPVINVQPNPAPNVIVNTLVQENSSSECNPKETKRRCCRFSRKRKRPIKTACGTAKEYIKESKRYIFSKKRTAGGCKPYLTAISKQNKCRIETVCLKEKGIRLRPQILSYPKSILEIKNKLEKKYECRICLYITCDGSLLFRSPAGWGKIVITRNGHKISKVDERCMSKYISKGLSNVEFEP